MGKIISEDTFIWTGNWYQTGKKTYIYDGDTTLISDVTENYKKDSIIPYLKNLYFKDTINNQIRTINQVWEDTAWMNVALQFDRYNADGLPAETEFQRWAVDKWDGTHNTWDTMSITYYTYNKFKNLIRLYNRNFVYGAWTPSSYDTMLFDNKSHIRTIAYKWDFNHWDTLYITENTYDILGRKTSRTMINLIDSLLTFSGRVLYIYESSTVKDVNKIESIQLVIIPNPAVDFINLKNIKSGLEIDRIEIYSVLGLKMMNFDRSSDAVMNTWVYIFLQIMVTNGFKKIMD